jgi:hypothetical protein
MTRLYSVAYAYKGCFIIRNTSPTALKWTTYCAGTFLAADTLRGMRDLITHTLKGE